MMNRRSRDQAAAPPLPRWRSGRWFHVVSGLAAFAPCIALASLPLQILILLLVPDPLRLAIGPWMALVIIGGGIALSYLIAPVFAAIAIWERSARIDPMWALLLLAMPPLVAPLFWNSQLHAPRRRGRVRGVAASDEVERRD